MYVHPCHASGRLLNDETPCTSLPCEWKAPKKQKDTVRMEIFGSVIFSVNRERRCSGERNFRYRAHCHFEGVANVRVHVQILRSKLLELPASFFLLETVIPRCRCCRG